MSRKRIVLVYVGTLLALLAVTWLVLRETGVARSFVQQALAGVLQPERFRMASASIDAVAGTVRIDDFHLATDGPGVELDVRRLDVGVSTHPLRDPGRLRDLRFEGARLELTLADGSLPDLAGLLVDRDENAEADDALPAIEIVSSQLLLRLDADRRPLTIAIPELTLLPLEDSPEKLAVLGRIELAIGPPIDVRGTVDTDGSLELSIDVTDAALSADRLAEIHPAGADWLAEFRASGRIAELTGTVRVSSDGTVGWDAAARLDELAFSSRHVPHAVQGATLEISSSDAEEGSARFTFDSKSSYGNVKAVGAATRLLEDPPRLEVEIDADDVLVRPELGRALAAIDEARQVWDAFEPDGGRASARAYYRRGFEERPQFELDIDVDRVGGRYIGFESSSGAREYGFPHPLHDIRGTVRVRRGVINVVDVVAGIGEGELLVRGTVDARPDDRPPNVALDFSSRSLEFTREVRDALAVLDAESAEIWDDYQPTGSTALDVRLRSDGTTPPDVRVHIRPLMASATAVDFPYRVDQIRGDVRIGGGAVDLELTGSRGAAEVEVQGRFAIDDAADAESPAAVLSVRGREIRSDDELRAALATLSPDVRTAIDFLGIEVRADLELSLWRADRSDAFRYDLRIDATDGSADIERLGLPIRGLTGPVILHGDGRDAHIDLIGLRGRIDNSPGQPEAEVVVQGEVDVTPDGPQLDVAAVVTGLELRDAIGDAVDRYGAFDRETWDVIEPSGFVDLVWRQSGRATTEESAAGQELELQLRGVRSGAHFLPAPAEDIYGRVTVRGRRAEFQDLVATMAGAELVCHTGMVEHVDDRTRFDIEVRSERFPLDDRLGRVLSGPLRETWIARNVDGAVRVVPLKLTMEFPDADPGRFTTGVSGSFEVLDVAFDLGTRIEGVSGVWTIEDARVGPEGGEVTGRIERAGATVLGHPILQAGARFAADTTSIRFRDLQGRLHGGRVSGGGEVADDVVYRFGDPGELSFDVAWENLSLESLARASGVTDASLRGDLSGRFRLEKLVGDRIYDAVGRGSLAIDEADLGEVPIFQTIYGYLEKPRRPRFEALSADFDIRDRRIGIDDLVVQSLLLRATGRGSISMDGYVDMVIDFPDFFGSDADWLFLPQLVRTVSNQIVRFKVFGYFRNLQSQPLWLGLGAPERVPLLPIPPEPDRDRR